MFNRSLFTLALVATFFVLTDLARGVDDWPQWRGPQRDGISTDTGLLKEWPEGGPKILWQVDSVGTGYSSIAAVNGRIYTQGDLAGVEHVICLDAKTGELIWAKQPAPLETKLAERVEEEMKRIDANLDGVVDESEAIGRLGFEFNNYDEKAEGDVKSLAKERADRLFTTLDANKDGKLTDEEAGRSFHRDFDRIDRKDDSADAGKLAMTRANAWIAKYDSDGDKQLDQKEAREGIVDRYFRDADKKIAGTREGDKLVTADELSEYLLKRQSGKDGLITSDELIEFYADRYPGGDGILTKSELKGYFGGYRNGMGDGPRGTPTVDGDRVYTEGGNGDVTCMEAATGDTIWHVNLSSDFGGGRPGWGYSESPLVYGDHVFVTPGGKQGTLMALDKKTGEKTWQTEEVTEGAHYSTPVIAEIHGTPTVVQFARGSLFGVTLDQGKLLWNYSGANNGTANCATPIIDDNHVFASSAYGTGGGLAKISKDGAGQKAEQVYFEKKMANHHGGIVKVGDHMYGFGSGLICMDFKTGEIAWQDRSVGKGSLTVADGMLYLLSEGHEVGLAEATPEGYREHGRFKIESHGRPSWAHPVVSGGVLYIRDQESLTAYDVKK